MYTISVNQKTLLYVVFLQSLIATLISLYYSEIRNFAPCVLCWYQRIFMYPLVLSSIVAIIRKDRLAHWYILPPAIIGFLIALYHVLLQTGMLSEIITPCAIGVSCITKNVGYFGFITIPVMSLASFTVIIISMYLFKKISKKS